jgi:hypothetical protein
MWLLDVLAGDGADDRGGEPLAEPGYSDGAMMCRQKKRRMKNQKKIR